jgi:hypothetical protein
MSEKEVGVDRNGNPLDGSHLTGMDRAWSEWISKRLVETELSSMDNENKLPSNVQPKDLHEDTLICAGIKPDSSD